MGGRSRIFDARWTGPTTTCRSDGPYLVVLCGPGRASPVTEMPCRHTFHTAGTEEVSARRQGLYDRGLRVD